MHRADPRPRRLAARRRRDRDAAGRTPRTARKPSQPHTAVPFVELGQVVDKGALRLLPPRSVTRHEIATDSGPIGYTATAGTLALHDQSGERVAAVFYISYVVDKPAAIKRPVTFVFNGGPGAASAYLHLGLVGPRLAEFRRRTRGPAAGCTTIRRPGCSSPTW